MSMSRGTLLLIAATAMMLCMAAVVVQATDLRPVLEMQPNRKGNTNVELFVRMDRIEIPLEPLDGSARTFEYTGRFYHTHKSGPLLPGPLIHAQAGGKIKLTLHNELGAETMEEGDPSMLYSFHGPNLTNVHFHGVHSNPKVDNPFKVLNGGDSWLYKLSIERDHVPGLHLYHAHSHGSTYYQLMGGLFGGIVVGEGNFMKTPDHPFRGWDNEVLLVHLYRLGKSEMCDGMTMTDMDSVMKTAVPSNPRIVDAHGRDQPLPANLYLVNGQHRPTVSATVGSPLVLRIGFAAGSCHLNLTLPPQCEFHLAAYDGVQLPRTRKANTGFLFFTTPTRIATVVVCHDRGVFPVRLADDADEVVFYLRATHAKKGKASTVPTATFPITMPDFNPDYLYLGSANVEHRELSLSQADLSKPVPYYVMGQGSDCASLHNSTTCIYKHFEGQRGTNVSSYDGFAVPLHSVVYMRVYGDPTDDRPHPLHFHTNHFQFLSFEPRPGGRHENQSLVPYGLRRGQFRDTIPILDGVTTIRWQAATYQGEMLYHCHALHHEDRGMMSSYLVFKDMKTATRQPIVFEPPKRTDYSWILLIVALLFAVGIGAVVVVRCLLLRNTTVSAGEDAPLLAQGSV